MVFSELPAGAKFCFGSVNKDMRRGNSPRFEQVDVPMVWKKTALDGLSVGIKECGRASFDYSRTVSGANRYVRTHGHRFFFLSSLYKYLNCADETWKQVTPGDRSPYAENNSLGFLSRFSEEEIRLLEPHQMKVKVPYGYTKKFGEEETKEVLVGIPSAEQIGDRYALGSFGVGFDRIDTWISDADTLSKYLSWGCTRRVGGDASSNIMPVIKIKADAPVDIDDATGNYIIRIPETNFDGDIDAFLGLTVEKAA